MNLQKGEYYAHILLRMREKFSYLWKHYAIKKWAYLSSQNDRILEKYWSMLNNVNEAFLLVF